jgi:phosphatidylglycerol:prolipoprotein diacylglycerol transferase
LPSELLPQISLAGSQVGQSYGLFLGLSLLLFLTLGVLLTWRQGFPVGKVVLTLGFVVIAALVGGRLLNVLTNFAFYRQAPSEIFSLHWTGFTLYGGLLLGALTGLLMSRLWRWNAWRLADALAPAVGLAIAAAKVGCFFNGCCYGLPTDLPWGVRYPMGSLPYLDQFSKGMLLFSSQSLPVHPTQLYEALAGLLGAGGALWLLGRKLPPGDAFLAFVLWFTACRWLISPLRASTSFLPVRQWLDPLLYALVIGLAAYKIGLDLAKKRRKVLAGR